MSIIQAIRDYIAACPLLHEGAIVGVDRLGAQGVAYTIDTTPCEPVVRQYVDGGSMRQFLFVFASREAYDTGDDTARYQMQLRLLYYQARIGGQNG